MSHHICLINHVWHLLIYMYVKRLCILHYTKEHNLFILKTRHRKCQKTTNCFQMKFADIEINPVETRLIVNQWCTDLAPEQILSLMLIIYAISLFIFILFFQTVKIALLLYGDDTQHGDCPIVALQLSYACFTCLKYAVVCPCRKGAKILVTSTKHNINHCLL